MEARVAIKKLRGFTSDDDVQVRVCVCIVTLHSVQKQPRLQPMVF